LLDLTGKTAIVTGASRGIGRAIATQLARCGAFVYAGARDSNAAETVAAIRAAGGSAELVSVDVTDAASVERMVATALEQRGRIDILVNNAGIARDQLMLRMKRDDWDQVLATNLTAAFSCVQAVTKPMVKQRAGRIVSITSVVGQTGNAGQANYAASKGGLIALTRTVAVEVARRGVTVNAVAPGFVETRLTEGIGANGLVDSIPARRVGTAEEVAACVRFLASPEASYVTGTTLTVDGGLSA